MNVPKNTGITFVLVGLLLLSMGAYISGDSDITLDQSSNTGLGTINGINYAYGVNSYAESGQYSLNVSGSIAEFDLREETVITSMDLISGFTINDIYYRVDRNIYNQDVGGVEKNFSSTVYYNSADFETIYVNPLLDLNADTNDLTNFTFTEEYRVTEVPVLVGSDIDAAEFVGQFPVNVSRSDFYNETTSGGIYQGLDIITPVAMLMDLTTETHMVAATTVNFNLAIVNYFNKYSMNYSIAADAFQVSLTDGDNFASHFTMFDKIEANYSESFLSYLQYNFVAAQGTDVEFVNSEGTAGNGTKVYDNKFFNYTIPLNLLPKRITSNGTTIEAGYREVNSTLKTTFQNVAAAFLTKNVTNTSAFLDQTTIESSLTAWSMSTSNNLVAFQDNGDDTLGVGVDDTGLVAKDDVVKYVGLTEAYSRDEYNAYYHTTEKNESANFYGLGIDVTNTNQNTTVFVDNFQSHQLGDTNAGTPIFYFNDPVAETDGSVTFDFGADYNGFPVSWVNVNNGAVTTDTSDIGFNYKVVVDPATGTAKISTTWTYAGVQDPTLKAKLGGLSLTTFVRSEFFTAKAVYTATPTNATLNASQTSAFNTLNINVAGSGDSALAIDVTGPKQNYVSGGSTYTAAFTALNIVQVSGRFSAEKASPFTSESENLGSSSTESGLIERLNVDYFYSADLLIITYPQWSGNDITHDPDYGISYASTQSEDDSSEEVSDDTDDTADRPVETRTAPVSDNPGLPGFGILLTSLVMMVTTIIYSRRRS